MKTITIESRIDSLVRRDQLLAVTFTVLMWTVLLFVFIVASAIAPTPGIVVALLLSLVALGVFNTASMVALVRRYGANRDLIYRQDIANLDRARRERTEKDR